MDRLFALVLRLQARGQQRARDLAADFEVSVRTIYRDMQALSEAGVPVVALPGQGYALDEGYFLPPLMFTTVEAGTLVLGADSVAGVLDEPYRHAAESAQAKLRNALTGDARRELAQIQKSMRFVQLKDIPRHDHLAELRQAILAKRALRISYHAYGRPLPEERIVEPHGLIHYNLTWHLRAYCRARQAPRNFRLDRIDAVTVLAEAAGSPPERNAHGRPDERHEAGTEIVVRVASNIVRWAREERPFGFVEERTEGPDVLMIFHLRDPSRVIRWLLGWGEAIEVLRPAELRAHMADQGRRITAAHHTPVHAVEGGALAL